ncbi:hypothetical protein F52700_5838 [Fusarium sp. NRRL 52700]|nr:hypothetical protein F52700_5838 [Fusarium sp. NRRL 52700]
MSPPSFSTLPEELQLQILGYIYKYSLIDLRLVSHSFARIITPIIFRAIRMRAYRDEPQRFVDIAMSEHLRYHVREVTLDTWTGSCDFQKREELMDTFFEAIPAISVFPRLDTLNIRLEHDTFHDKHHTQLRLLEMLFHWMEGVFRIHEYLRGDTMPLSNVSSQQARAERPLRLKTLAISNLVDISGMKRLLSFQSVMNSGTLRDLRISTVNLGKHMSHQDVHHDLLDTVLCPRIANNLQVLSLFSPAYWGWLPNMYFRLVGPNDLSNLKVLALGRFEFSSWWQVEWIGSLGIEKLYLDECTVLHSDSNRATSTSVAVCQGEAQEARPPQRVEAWREASTYHTHTRWHHIFEHWANTMPNLRVFKFGQGWSLDDNSAWKAVDPTYDGDFYEYVEEDHEAIFQPFQDTNHQHFECPLPLTIGTGIRQYGSEAVQSYGAVFTYVERVSGWGRDYTDSPGEGKEFMSVSSGEEKRDMKAFDEFLTVVETRRKGLVGQELEGY